MCSPVSHKAFTLGVPFRKTNVHRRRFPWNPIRKAMITHSPDLLVTFALRPSHASVYIKMLFMCTSLINFLVRAKKKKKSQTEKASDMRFEKLDQNIFISRAFLSISPSPATMLCAWNKQKSVRTLTTKASSMVWKQKFPIDNISACYFSLTLGRSSLSRSCCLLAS